MGNALAFNNAIAQINSNNANQFYVDNAQQYGKIIGLIIEFSYSQIASSLTTDTGTYLSDLFSGKLRNNTDNLGEHPKELAKKFYQLQDSFIGKWIVSAVGPAALAKFQTFLQTPADELLKQFEPVIDISAYAGTTTI
jgi:hypothetical protein